MSAVPFTVVMVAPQGVRVGRHVTCPVGRLIGELDAGLSEAGHRCILVADAGSTSAREFVALPEGRGPFLHAAIDELLAATKVDLVHLHHPSLLLDALPRSGLPVLVTLHGDPRDEEAAAFQWRRGVYPHTLTSWQRGRCPPHTPLLHEIAPGLTPSRSPALLRARTPKLVAIGLGDDDDPLAALAGRCGLPVVRIDDPYGWRRFISGATALWIGSGATHSLWPTALEAICAGTPVLTPHGGALAELVDDGVSGITYPAAETFERALKACAALPRRECRRHASERHASSRMVERFLAAYSALAGHGAWVHLANGALAG